MCVCVVYIVTFYFTFYLSYSFFVGASYGFYCIVFIKTNTRKDLTISIETRTRIHTHVHTLNRKIDVAYGTIHVLSQLNQGGNAET